MPQSPFLSRTEQALRWETPEQRAKDGARQERLRKAFGSPFMPVKFPTYAEIGAEQMRAVRRVSVTRSLTEG